MKTLAFLLLPISLAASAHAAEPKGHFVLVGGGGTGSEIRGEFVRLAGGKDARIVIIPSASDDPGPATAGSLWRSYRVPVSVLHATDRSAAADAKLYACLDQATGVWIGGGRQSYFMHLFSGTPLADKLKTVLARGGVVGGTSAGASVVTGVMVLGASEGRGLGLLEGFIVDQHFSERHRLPRLKRLIEKYADKVGYGIDENTALVLSGGSIKVLGAGTVTRYRANGETAVLRATR